MDAQNVPAELPEEHSRLALHLAMSCTLILAKADRIPDEFAAVLAK